MAPLTLGDLGPRICILGPSNSGKSTLATAIERARGLPAIHLDQLYHLPATDWEPRPIEEFLALHNEAIQAPAWVMDGSYLRTLPQRLARATGVIRLEASTPVSLFRYLRRAWFEHERNGALAGGDDSVKWAMIRHIALTTRRNRERDLEAFRRIDLPKIRLPTRRSIADFYRAEALQI